MPSHSGLFTVIERAARKVRRGPPAPALAAAAG